MRYCNSDRLLGNYDQRTAATGCSEAARSAFVFQGRPEYSGSVERDHTLYGAAAGSEAGRHERRSGLCGSASRQSL